MPYRSNTMSTVIGLTVQRILANSLLLFELKIELVIVFSLYVCVCIGGGYVSVVGGISGYITAWEF